LDSILNSSLSTFRFIEDEQENGKYCSLCKECTGFNIGD
jgi:hypothetical protein